LKIGEEGREIAKRVLLVAHSKFSKPSSVVRIIAEGKIVVVYHGIGVLRPLGE
jgi:hypothetical protein